MKEGISNVEEPSNVNAVGSASAVLYARTNSGELVLRLGADLPFSDLKMLETGEPVYSPVTQV